MVEEPLQRSLERYDVLDRIAVGGMAEVFLAKAYGAHGFEKTLAIKRILPELARDPEFEARFIAEAKVAVRLSHANVVQVFDFGRIGESLFIAMEYVDGLDLAAMLRKFKEEKRQVPLPAAFHIAIEIVRALDFAHGHNVVHRDVSPSNILISRAGEVKIADFGIAVAAQPHRNTGGGPKRVMGKWRYMSPEQTRGDTLDTRSDLFSAAAVIYELFTNEKLFPGEEAPEIIKNIADMPIPKMTALRPNLPSRLDDVLAGPLSRKPIDRPTRPATVLRSLIELSYESSIMATALDVAEALSTVIPAKRVSGRGALDDVIRKQLHEGSVVARKTAITDGKPPSTQSVVRTAEAEAPGDVSTGLFRKIDRDGLPRLEIDESAGADRISSTDLHAMFAKDKDRHTEVGGPPAPTGQVPKDIQIDSTAETKPAMEIAKSIAPEPVAKSRAPLVALLLLLLVGGGVAAWRFTRTPASETPVVVTPPPVDAAVPVEPMGTIIVESIPSGALVTLEDKELGPSPQSANVSAGKPVRVRIVLAGYQPFEESYTVAANTRFAIRPTLVAAPATLVVETTPPGATVTVAGSAVGTTPLTYPVAAAKGVEVKIAKLGFEPIVIKSDFVAGQTATIQRELKEAQKFGFVTVTLTGSVGWADVYLGGKLIGRNSGASGLNKLQLPAGRHTLRLVNPLAKKEHKLVVDVKERETKSFTTAFP